jgi:hypothetical protein
MPDGVHLFVDRSFQLIGLLHCLSQIFKKGHRNNVLPFAAMALGPCLALSEQANQTLVRKLLIKVCLSSCKRLHAFRLHVELISFVAYILTVISRLPSAGIPADRLDVPSSQRSGLEVPAGLSLPAQQPGGVWGGGAGGGGGWHR